MVLNKSPGQTRYLLGSCNTRAGAVATSLFGTEAEVPPPPHRTTTIVSSLRRFFTSTLYKQHTKNNPHNSVPIRVSRPRLCPAARGVCLEEELI